jgi:hypothetical protein
LGVAVLLAAQVRGHVVSALDCGSLGDGPLNLRISRAVFGLGSWLLVGGVAGSASFAQEVNPIASLAGRWAGTATMLMASGPSELFRCVATYFPGEGGASLRQNLRCKSANYQFDGTTQLKINAGKVTGQWQDKINPLYGTVSGTVTPDGFLIFLSGELFDAKMTVVGSRCQQSITIILEEGLPVKRLSADLRKC